MKDAPPRARATTGTRLAHLRVDGEALVGAVIDLGLPGMDGLATLGALRLERPGLPALPGALEGGGGPAVSA